MSNLNFRRAIYLLLWLAVGCTPANLWAVEVSIPGTWFDQDKYHLPSSPEKPYEDITGDSWHVNWCENSSHSAGDAWSEENPGGWYELSDLSCWMASAANLVRYMGGGDWYYTWAYANGIEYLGADRTFDESGPIKDPLIFVGYDYKEIEDGIIFGWDENPVQWIENEILNNTPVGIIIATGGSDGHALTVYSIDTDSGTMRIANSDSDWDGNLVSPTVEDYREVSYSWDGTDFNINMYSYVPGGTVNDNWYKVTAATCIDSTGNDNDWQGSGTGGNTATSGSTTRWTTPGNWSIGHAPIPNDFVVIDTTNSGKVIIDCEAKADTVVSEGSAPVELTAGSSLATTLTVIGGMENSTFNHLGGTHDVSDALILGYSEGTGYYTLSSGSIIAHTEYAGLNASGVFNQTGGSNTVSEDLYLGMWIGNGPTAHGSYILSSGALSVGEDLSVGFEGTGTFTQTGGTNSVGGSLVLGWTADSHGSYTISDGTLDVRNADITVGLIGQGEFHLNGGTVIADEFNVGPTGTFASVGHGTLIVNSLAGMGDSFALNGSLWFGHWGGSHLGNYSLAEGESLVVSDNLWAGVDRSVDFVQTGGTAVADCLVVGNWSRYELSGTGELWTTHEHIGNYYIEQYDYIPIGIGLFIQRGGRNVIEEDLHLFSIWCPEGAFYELHDGELVAENEYVGYLNGELQQFGAGYFWQTGGINRVGTSLVIGYGEWGTGGFGTYEMSGGLLDVRDGTIQVGPLWQWDWPGGDFNMNGGLVIANFFYVGQSGLFSSSGSGTLRVNTLDAGDQLTLNGSLQLGHSGGSAAGSYTLAYGDRLEVSENLVVGHDAPAIIEQSGGVCTVGDSLYIGHNSGSSGTYELSGDGQLTTTSNQYIGYQGTGTFTQTGGTNTVNSGLRVADESNSTGSYLLGDEFTTGTLRETPSGASAELFVRGDDDPVVGASGVFRGWGEVLMSGQLRNNGRVVADGYGTDRDLDLSRFSSVANDDTNGIVQGDGTQAGWYAQDHGRLVLPAVAVAAGDSFCVWGEEAADTTLDLVNSLRIVFDDVAAAGELSIDLLAVDRDDVPQPVLGSLLGVWDFQTSDGFEFDSADLVFRYDDALAASLGITDNFLRIYHFTGDDWADITSAIDMGNHCIFADAVESFSLFAVGAGLPDSLLPGDANGDYIVDEEDAAILAANWLRMDEAVTWADGDFNDDGMVNDIDATLMATNWQYGVDAASIPEPGMLALLLGLSTFIILSRPSRKPFGMAR